MDHYLQHATEFKNGGRRGRDFMVVGLTTLCATSAFYH